MVEYGVVIRRQFPQGELRWQLWLGSGVVREDSNFLVVMNHAGSLGFEAVAAGHFDDLGVPEVLLQRRVQAPVEPRPVKAAAEKVAPAKKAPVSAATAKKKTSPARAS